MAVVVTGLEELKVAFNNFVFDIDKAVEDAVRVTAVKVQKNAIALIKEPSIGTYVTRYTGAGNPYQHVASKPGDAPNTDTGRLIGSINMSHNSGDLFAFVFTNLDYGFFLETVQDRPWLNPAKDMEINNFGKRITQALEIQIEKAGR